MTRATGRGLADDRVDLALPAASDRSLARLTGALLWARTLIAVATAAAQFARSAIPDARAALFWSLRLAAAKPRALRCSPASARVWADAALAQSALQGAGRQEDTHEGRVRWSWPLPLAEAGSAVLQIEARTPPGDAALAAVAASLPLLATRVQQLLKVRQLERAVCHRERSALLQTSLYAISDVASSELDRADMLRAVHQIVGALM